MRNDLVKLRRRTLPPLALSWAALIAAVAVGDLLALAVLPLLGIVTFNYITGWPIKTAVRRGGHLPGVRREGDRPASGP